MNRKNYKVVVFDFDGTLTHKQNNIWKAIWQKLGYDVSKSSYFAELFGRFLKKEITHQEWCDLTCEKFQEKGFSFEMLIEQADGIALLPGINDTFKALQDNEIEIYILSGNIRQVIIKSFENYGLMGFFNKPRNMLMAQNIFANNMAFDQNSHILSRINGTNYDFEGKAHFIEELKSKTGLSSNEILYVCDDDFNDKWVELSCCDTLYINSDNEANNDKSNGPISMPNVLDIRQILPHIFPNVKQLEVNKG